MPANAAKLMRQVSRTGDLCQSRPSKTLSIVATVVVGSIAVSMSRAGLVLNRLKTTRVLISIPFFVIEAAFLVGVVWLGVGRLLEGFEWKKGDGLIVGWLIALTIFAGAFLQFGKDALYKGHTEVSKPLVGPLGFYLIGVFVLVPGVWSFLAGSQHAIAISAVGFASIVNGVRLSKRTRSRSLGSINQQDSSDV